MSFKSVQITTQCDTNVVVEVTINASDLVREALPHMVGGTDIVLMTSPIVLTPQALIPPLTEHNTFQNM